MYDISYGNGFDGGLMTIYSTTQLYNQHCNLQTVPAYSLKYGRAQALIVNMPRRQAPW